MRTTEVGIVGTDGVVLFNNDLKHYKEGEIQMAHGPQCIGTWEKSKLGATDDGKIKIDFHNTNQITGTHTDTSGNSSPIKGTCNGQKQDFKRTISGSNKKIHYKNGNITQTAQKFLIKGKFAEESEAESKAKSGGKKTDALPDDWTAEKAT